MGIHSGRRAGRTRVVAAAGRAWGQVPIRRARSFVFGLGPPPGSPGALRRRSRRAGGQGKAGPSSHSSRQWGTLARPMEFLLTLFAGTLPFVDPTRVLLGAGSSLSWRSSARPVRSRPARRSSAFDRDQWLVLAFAVLAAASADFRGAGRFSQSVPWADRIRPVQYPAASSRSAGPSPPTPAAGTWPTGSGKAIARSWSVSPTGSWVRWPTHSLFGERISSSSIPPAPTFASTGASGTP